MTNRELAIYMAGWGHQDQNYGESPYLFHLSEVDKVLADAQYELEDAVRVASWVHDVIEDTNITLDMIEARLGPAVADIVHGVTDEAGVNRKERKARSYPKIAASRERVIVKLADRIANLEQSLRTGSSFGLMYLKEDDAFQQALDIYHHYNTDIGLAYLWARYRQAIATLRNKYGMARASH